jgi:hypothetical protein
MHRIADEPPETGNRCIPDSCCCHILDRHYQPQDCKEENAEKIRTTRISSCRHDDDDDDNLAATVAVKVIVMLIVPNTANSSFLWQYSHSWEIRMQRRFWRASICSVRLDTHEHLQLLVVMACLIFC